MCVDSRSTISRMCDVRKIVPPRPTNDSSSSLICREATASMPSNGSSRKSRRGAGQQGGGERQLLAHPVREVGDQRATGGLQIHHDEQVAGAAPRGVAIEGVDLCDERQGFFRRQAIEEREILGYDADLALDRHRIGKRIDAQDAHRSR